MISMHHEISVIIILNIKKNTMLNCYLAVNNPRTVFDLFRKLMIWFLIQSLSYFLYSWRLEKPSRSSVGFLGHFDETFVEWTERLVEHPFFIGEQHWLLKCPEYMRSCCPRVNELHDDHAVMNRLTDLSPAHAFCYVLLRRFAEVVVRFAGSWVLSAWLVASAFSLWLTWQRWVIPNHHIYRKQIGHNAHLWNLKVAWLLLSLMPLSIIMSFLSEAAVGDVHQLQVSGAPQPSSNLFLQVKSAWVLWWHAVLYRNESPYMLSLLRFFSLHQALYGASSSPVDVEGVDRFCRPTGAALSWWSVFFFIATVYGIGAVALDILVWRPLKTLSSNLLLDDSGERRRTSKETKGQGDVIDSDRRRTSKEITNGLGDVIDKCSQKILTPGNRKRASDGDFSTYVDVPKDYSETTSDDYEMDKLFDKYYHPDPEFSISEKGDSRPGTFLKKREAGENPKPESGDGRNVRGLPKAVERRCSSDGVVIPRYISRGTYACMDSSCSSSSYTEDSDSD